MPATFMGTKCCEGDQTWLDAAYDFGDLLVQYARSDARGVSWPAEHCSIVTPDYMVGYSGTADYLLRLTTPNQPRESLRIPAI